MKTSLVYSYDDYRFGFNGQEKDNEIKGTGNSLSYEARIYDSRLGRWLSLDPLQAKYPSLSPYHYANNNPIYFIDKEGKYFTGSTDELKAIYNAVCKLAEKEDVLAQQFKAILEKMDASDVEYNISFYDGNSEGNHGGGSTSFNDKSNRVEIMVDRNTGGIYNDNLYGKLGHELAHGGQFENGELDFDVNSGGNGGPSHDIFDEHAAVDIGTMVNGLFTQPWSANGTPIPAKSKADAEAQKKEYNDEGLKTEKRNIPDYSEYPEGKQISYDVGERNRTNYSPTEKQKSEKKQILVEVK